MRIMSAASTHRSHSRRQAPHLAAADAGHCRLTLLAPRRSSRRIGAQAGALVRGIGASTKALDGGQPTATVSGRPIIPRWGKLEYRLQATTPAAPRPHRSQRRTRLALSPWASETPATVPLAGLNHLTLELWCMVAPGALRQSALHSPPYLLGGPYLYGSGLGISRCLHRTLTDQLGFVGPFDRPHPPLSSANENSQPST
jgi:hypothetical protein